MREVQPDPFWNRKCKIAVWLIASFGIKILQIYPRLTIHRTLRIVINTGNSYKYVQSEVRIVISTSPYVIVLKDGNLRTDAQFEYQISETQISGNACWI